MSQRRIAFTTLFSTLLDGCSYSCGTYQEVHDAATFEVTTEALAAASDASGEITTEGCRDLCGHLGGDSQSCTRAVETGDTGAEDDATIAIECTSYRDMSVCDGRGHTALVVDARPQELGTLGGRLARSAWDEAASVGAFRRLARELRLHGAPASLVERARAAAGDEIRHARVLRRLARDHGARPLAPQFRTAPVRDLFALALENAVEGCVRETVAALSVALQARRARASLRPVFARIAVDETRHAEWSWDLDRWLRTQLTAAEDVAVDRARDAAFCSIIASVAEPTPLVREVLGVPTAAVSRALAAGLFDAVRTVADG